MAKKQPVKDKPKNLGGAPTKYSKDILDDVFNMTLLGATDKELAEHYDVTRQTIQQWKKDHAEFSYTIKKGKKYADGKVARSMYDRACGYSHPEEKIFCYNGEIVRATTMKHYPPDTAAAFIWLKNRAPDIWRDKQEFEHNGNVAPITINLVPTDSRDKERNALTDSDDQ